MNSGFLKSRLAGESSWMFLSLLFRVCIQMVYFIFLARSLGSSQYGAFASTIAFVSVFAPFAGIGTGNLLVKNVAADPNSFSRSWGSALLITLISAICISIIVFIAFATLFSDQVSWILLSCIILSELFFSRLIDISSQAFQAFKIIKTSALIQIIPSLLRFLAILFFFLVTDNKNIDIWSILFLVSTIMSSMVSLWLVRSTLGWGNLQIGGFARDYKEGLAFSISLSSQNIYNDIDKTMLSKMSNYESAGVYSAAYRVMDVAFTPIKSIFFASYARFFESGSKGITGTIDFAKKISPIILALSGAIILLLNTISPLVPSIFGDDFSESALILRILSLVIFFRSINYLLADSLTGAGYQKQRSVVQFVGCIVNIGLNLVLIPYSGAKGAAFASVVTETTIFLLLLYIMIRKARFERQK
ncbi:oligosaccharide flippase family protein [Deinococcus indicus]|uniref:oligosaccharide flippase family protein n=1 Tax=Deinococcus indicus TaxID=223556 RepID=UPI001177AAE3|nr:oligosaccharide flippase family protein [Deinococcus indicus]